MKKIIALVLVTVMLAMALVSCGGISGTYSAEIIGSGAEYAFKGSKVTITPKLLGSYGDPIEGKYKIKDGKITITFEGDEEDSEYAGTYDFEQGEGYIKIGAIKYTEVEK